MEMKICIWQVKSRDEVTRVRVPIAQRRVGAGRAYPCLPISTILHVFFLVKSLIIYYMCVVVVDCKWIANPSRFSIWLASAKRNLN